MIVSALKSTTALALCLTLVSAPGFAQTGNAEACAADVGVAVFPCVIEGGRVVESADALMAARAADGAAAEAAAAQAAANEAAAAEAAAAEAAAAQAATDEAAAAEAAAAQAAADEAAAAEAAAAQAAANEAAAAEAAAAQAAADEAAAAEAAAAETAANEAAAAEAAAAQAAANEAAAAEAAAAQAAANEAAAAEAEAAAASAAAEATAEAEREAAEAAAAATAVPAISETTPAVTEPVTTVEGRSAEESEAAAAAAAIAEAEAAGSAAASAGATGDADTTAVVTTETVDESTVRSSDQDFDTTVAPAAPAATAAAPAPSKKLSNFEKVLLVGLGAVAVGAILKNGDRVVSNSGDRVVVERDGELRVLKDDDARLRQPGSEVRTETFSDGSTRTTVQRSDGSEVVTIRGADGSVLLRERVMPDGTHYTLFDDTTEAAPVNVKKLPKPVKLAAVDQGSNDALRRALSAELQTDIGRSFSLRQVRYLPEVRQLAPEIALESIRFPSGSAAIPPEQARELARIGLAVADLIDEEPGAVILIEGHTDAVGDAGYNLALSDRRAETVALALSEYFEVPAENIVTQGYGETELKVPTLADEPANRRAVLRNITGLLR